MLLQKKGKRGKKICGDCEGFVPIHCRKCIHPKCGFIFKMEHKVKAKKEPFLGLDQYAYSQV
jgi:hypothetical protein